MRRPWPTRARNGIRLLSGALAICAVSALGEARAQQSLKAAGGSSTLREREYGTLSYDATEEALSVLWLGSRPLKASGNPIPSYLSIDTKVTLAAEKGERTLFEGGHFVPGAELQLTGSYTRERTNVGYHAFLLAVRGEALLRETATRASGTDPYQLEETAGGTAALAIGYNFGVTEDLILGIGAEARREWRSPGEAQPNQVCVTTSTGVDVDGNTVAVADCGERYTVGLSDTESGQFRADMRWVLPLGFLGPKDPTVGLISAVSANVRDGSRPVWRAAFGPSFQPPGKPSHVIAAALVELEDLTRNVPVASGERRKTFFVRLYIGVPFALFQ